ncbi:MAG: hypothetical protein RL338_1260 [Chloroflexota bacterium]|jgi:amino acid transporter
MDASWAPFAVVAAIVLVSFVANTAVGPRFADRLNSMAIELDTPWRRPRLLAGKSLVVLWFLAAALYVASLPGTLVVDASPIGSWSLPALLAAAAMTLAAVTYKRSLAQRPHEELDERERRVRDVVFLSSYRIVVWILGALIVAYLLLVLQGVPIEWRNVPLDTLLGVSVTAAVFLSVLPSLVHAWRDPSPDEVSEEAEEALAVLRREVGKALGTGPSSSR